jgi:hypothetical protein
LLGAAEIKASTPASANTPGKWLRAVVTPRVPQFFRRRARDFRTWWAAPASTKDRVIGAFVGGLGCFWIGVLGRIMLGPVGMSTLGVWALGSIATGVVLGICFPKATTVVCFPFSTFG